MSCAVCVGPALMIELSQPPGLQMVRSQSPISGGHQTCKTNHNMAEILSCTVVL